MSKVKNAFWRRDKHCKTPITGRLVEINMQGDIAFGEIFADVWSRSENVWWLRFRGKRQIIDRGCNDTDIQSLEVRSNSKSKRRMRKLVRK